MKNLQLILLLGSILLKLGSVTPAQPIYVQTYASSSTIQWQNTSQTIAPSPQQYSSETIASPQQRDSGSSETIASSHQRDSGSSETIASSHQRDSGSSETIASSHQHDSGRSETIESHQPHNEFKEMAEFLGSVVAVIQGEECREQVLTLLTALDNSSLWAVQMLDSSSKIPMGLISANTYQFGDFDQCLGVRAGSILGKYCLSEVTFEPKLDKYPEFYRQHMDNAFSLQYDPYKPVWEKFIVTEDPSKRRRNLFYSGVCLPHACEAADVERFLRQLTAAPAQQYGFSVNVSVSEQSCATAEPKPFSTGANVLCGVMGMFVAAVIICTAWDLTRDRQRQTFSKFHTLMESFSIHKNITKLSTPDPTPEMDVFHGMKTLSIMLIIMGHRCVSSYGGPFFNPEFLEERYRKFQDMLLLNGTLIVDTFFLIGGYMTFLGLLREYQANKKIKTSQVFFYRWLRITPVYMLVVFFYAYLLEHLSSGPVWNLRVGREAARCRENWWTNFLYINNYINTDKLCMFQSWYVTCDMHFILLAPLVARLTAKTPGKGLALLSSLITISVLVPFITTYIYKYDGVLRVYMSIFEDLASNFMFTKVYIRSHNRAIPYFIGMAAAYTYTRVQASGYLFSKLQTWVLSLTATVFALSAICGAWVFYIPGRRYDPLENAIYAAFHRVLWGLAMAWIPVAGGQRAFGIIQPILSMKAYTPFSRLCFGAFLLHGAIQMFTTMTLRSPQWMSFPKLFWMTSGDIMMSFFFSFLLHVLFEAPMGGIQKLILKPKKAKIQDNKNGDKDISRSLQQDTLSGKSKINSTSEENGQFKNNHQIEFKKQN